VSEERRGAKTDGNDVVVVCAGTLGLAAGSPESARRRGRTRGRCCVHRKGLPRSEPTSCRCGVFRAARRRRMIRTARAGRQPLLTRRARGPLLLVTGAGLALPTRARCAITATTSSASAIPRSVDEQQAEALGDAPEIDRLVAAAEVLYDRRDACRGSRQAIWVSGRVTSADRPVSAGVDLSPRKPCLPKLPRLVTKTLVERLPPRDGRRSANLWDPQSA